jgi:hypothetical protein
MADITGTVHADHGGKRYALRLTMRGLAELQAEFGQDLGGITTHGEGAFPNMAPILRLVELSLRKGQPDMSPETAADLADEMLTADIAIVQRILTAAFPSVAGGSARPRKAA